MLTTEIQRTVLQRALLHGGEHGVAQVYEDGELVGELARLREALREQLHLEDDARVRCRRTDDAEDARGDWLAARWAWHMRLSWVS